jgi:hypothetical protein
MTPTTSIHLVDHRSKAASGNLTCGTPPFPVDGFSAHRLREPLDLARVEFQQGRRPLDAQVLAERRAHRPARGCRSPPATTARGLGANLQRDQRRSRRLLDPLVLLISGLVQLAAGLAGPGQCACLLAHVPGHDRFLCRVVV